MKKSRRGESSAKNEKTREYFTNENLLKGIDNNTEKRYTNNTLFVAPCLRWRNLFFFLVKFIKLSIIVETAKLADSR